VRALAAIAVATALAAAGAGMAVGRGAAQQPRAVSATACAGAARDMVEVTVRVPGGVRAASLLAADGSSIQGNVSGGSASFLFAPDSAAATGASRVEYADAAGDVHRVAVDATRAARTTCSPPGPVSVGRRVRGPRDVQLAARPINPGGPRLSARVYRTDAGLCVRAGRGPLTQRCVRPGALGRQDGMQGWAYRAVGGETVLGGVADPAAVEGIRVRRRGWPSRAQVTLPLSTSGAFLLVEADRFDGGATWELRPVYRASHRRVMRLVGIAPPAGGAPATRVAPRLLDHFAVLRRPREAKDALPRDGRPRSSLVDVNPAFSRLVAERYGAKVWVIPGERSICTLLDLPGDGAATGCGPTDFDALYTGHSPTGSVTVGPWSWRPHRMLVFVFLPDGSSDALLERDGRAIRSVRIAGNAVLVRAHGADRVSWLAPDGSRQHLAIR
jgi:hypothetical protein